MKFYRALALCLAVAAPAVYSAALQDPAPIGIPAGRSAEDVSKAIKLGLSQQQWIVASEEPRRILATYLVRTHIAKVAISYDATQVTFSYLDSSNLDYEEQGDKREIHRNYNKWTAAMADRIAEALARTDLGSLPAESLAQAAPQMRSLTNSPPTEKFSNFARFELMPTALQPPFAGQDPNERAAAKIQENLEAGLGKLLNGWNQQTHSGAQRTLRIEPVVTQIRFIGVGARIFVGAMAGSSSVTMKVRFVDTQSGLTVAEPVFELKAGARAGGQSFGAADNLMFPRIAEMIRDYTSANYAEAVGGLRSLVP